MGGGVPGLPATKPGFCIGVALFEDVDDMKATLPARNGSKAVVGLARRAIEAADLVVDSILATCTKERTGKGVESGGL